MSRYTKIRTVFISGNNIKFERRDFKKRSEVKIINEPTNYTLHTYRFNNIELDYDTKYMNWADMNCCNGCVYDREYLKNEV